MQPAGFALDCADGRRLSDLHAVQTPSPLRSLGACLLYKTLSRRRHASQPSKLCTGIWYDCQFCRTEHFVLWFWLSPEPCVKTRFRCPQARAKQAAAAKAQQTGPTSAFSPLSTTKRLQPPVQLSNTMHGSNRTVLAEEMPIVEPTPPYKAWGYLVSNELAQGVGRQMYYTDEIGQKPVPHLRHLRSLLCISCQLYSFYVSLNNALKHHGDLCAKLVLCVQMP